MNKTSFSLIAGALAGALVCAATFAVVSIARPGWLRSLVAPQPPPAIVVKPLPTEPGQPDVFSTATPIPNLPEPTPLPTDAAAACGGPQHLTIALLGVDDREGNYSKPTRTDAISLVNVRFTDKTAALMSIPRDLYVAQPNLEHAGITQDRINTAWLHGEVYGVEGGGPAELKNTVELNFGIRVHRYVLVNFGAFIQFVDALGGIDMEVPEAIYDPRFPREDGSGTFILEVPAGVNHFDGLAALRYARTRHQDDDYHRVRRQQLLLLAIRDRLLSPDVIPQIPALIGALGGLVRTDLSAEELAALACLGPQIDRASIQTVPVTANNVIPWTTPTGAQVSIPNRDTLGPLVRTFLGQ
jgi:LCP family protein required for cell wall assembly